MNAEHPVFNQAGGGAANNKHSTATGVGNAAANAKPNRTALVAMSCANAELIGVTLANQALAQEQIWQLQPVAVSSTLREVIAGLNADGLGNMVSVNIGANIPGVHNGSIGS